MFGTDLELPMPGAPSDIWTARRRALSGVLGRRDRICSDLYRRAIDTLGESPLSAVALMTASHCLRELVNRLPGVLGAAPSHSGTDLKVAARRLALVWPDHREPLVRAAEDGGNAPVENLAAVIERIDPVVHAYNAGGESAKAKRSAVALGNSKDLDNPTVLSFKAATDFFEEFRHPQSGAADWPTEVDSLLPELLVIETAIEGRIGNFFAIVDDLNLLLPHANSRDDITGAWSEPSEDLFRDVISRIGDLKHRGVFFAGLQNPMWALKLCNAGALDPPPAEDRDEDVPSYTPWPAGPYLVLVAAEAPEAVTSALLRASAKTDAHEVQRILVAAGKKLPPKHITKLKPVLLRICGGPLDPLTGLGIAEMAESLALDGQYKAALQLGNTLLRPRPPQEGAARRRAAAGIRSHWYGKALDHFLTGLNGHKRLLPTVVAWLENALDSDTETGPYDLSYLDRPSIGAAPTGSSRNEIIGYLVDAVRDVCITVVRDRGTAEAVAEHLERGRHPLLKRIERHVFAVAATEFPQAVLSAVWRCLLDRAPLDGHTTPREYFELARAVLPLLGENEYQEWEALILSGPLDTPERRRNIQEHLGAGEAEAQVWTDYVERWQLDRLGTIGSESLRGRTADLLATLADRLEAPMDPSPEGVRVTWSGDASEDLVPKFRELSPSAAIELVGEWTSSGDDIMGSAEFDMGKAFATAVAERALEFSRLAETALQLPEVFATRFLDGIRSALDANVPIAWDPLLAALLELPGPVLEPTIHGEPRWHYQVVTALHAIEKALSSPDSGFSAEHLEPALEFAMRYIRPVGPAPDSPSSAVEIQSDPLVSALNSFQPAAVTAAVRLLVHAKSNALQQTDVYVDRVCETLDTLLTPILYSTPPIAAAFGAALGRLQWVAPDWVAARAPDLLSVDWYGDIVASIALLYHSRIDGFFDVLTPKLSEFLTRAADGEDFDWNWTNQESVIKRIGLSLVFMTLNRAETRAHPLMDEFFDKTPIAIRASVLGSSGRLLGNADSVPAEVVTRAQELWDRRADAVGDHAEDAAELSEFHTWVHSGLFPVEWWLPRLGDLAEHIDVEGFTYLGEDLAEASKSDPAAVVSVLNRLVRRTTASWLRHDLVGHAPAVIVRALSIGGDAAEAAEELMDYLGREGYVNLDAQVEQTRNQK